MHFLSLFHCIEHCLLFIALIVAMPIIGIMFVPQTIMFSQQQTSTYRLVYDQQLQSQLKASNNSYVQPFAVKMRNQCQDMSLVYQWMIESCLLKCGQNVLNCGLVRSSVDQILNDKWKYTLNNITYFAQSQIKNQIARKDNTSGYIVQFNNALLPLYRYSWNIEKSEYIQQRFIFISSPSINCSSLFEKIGNSLQSKFDNVYANYYESTEFVAFLLVGLVILSAAFFFIRTLKIFQTTGFITQKNRGYTQWLRSQNILLLFINLGLSIELIVSFFKLQWKSDDLMRILGRISQNCVANPYNTVFKIEYQRDSVSFVVSTIQGLLMFIYFLMIFLWAGIRIAEWRYRKIKEDVSSSSYQLHPM